jgi:acetyltransferase-like isoleucine patch superfamily enzyme
MIRIIFKSIYHSCLATRDYIYSHMNIGFYRKSWRFWGLPILSKHKDSIIEIGENFIACSQVSRNSIGVNQKVIIKTVAKNAEIIIGNNVGISGATISCSLSITIGDDTMIGSGVLITDSDAHSIHPELRKDSKYARCKPIVIENNVFIGARSIVLKGVRIGEGSVIGAGSVVTKDVHPMSIAAGNPAKIVGSIEDVEKYRDIL